MNKRSIEFAALAIALTFAGACTGRTAAWEEKSSTPESTGATDAKDKPAPTSAMEAGLTAWAARADGEANVFAAITAWEDALGCTAGSNTPEERCASVAPTAENAELLAWSKTERNFHEPDKFGTVEFVIRP